MSWFNSIEELEKQVIDLDSADYRKVYVDAADGGKVESKKYVAVWNNNKQDVACVATNEYTILQHQDAFLPVVQALKSFGKEIKGDLINEGNRVILNVLFPHETIIPSDKEPILYGLRFSNSYDLSQRFRGGGYGLRLVCTNGMVGIGNIGVNLAAKHIGKKVLIEAKSISRLFQSFLDSKARLSEQIEEAIHDFVETENIEKWLEKELDIGERTAKKISEKLESGTPSRWDIYNAITSYASHESKSIDNAELYNRKAVKVLAMVHRVRP